MLTVRVTDDLAKLTTAIGNIGSRHIPRSTVIALTRTAVKAKEELTSELTRAFDRPTPFTMNALFVRPATMQSPAAEVFIKDFAPKGTPAIKYLAPSIYAGQRRQKRFERALTASGLMPAGMSAVPGQAAPLDQYGNVSGPYITKMLSQLRAMGQQGYTANETDKGKARRLKRDRRTGDWLVVREKRGKLHPGIYRRYHFGFGNTLKPIFIFTSKQPQYRQRYNFFEITNDVIERHFPDEFVRAFGEAIGRFGA